MKTRVAFFDLDGTIVGTWFHILFVKYQYEQGRVNQEDYDNIYNLKRSYQADRYNLKSFRNYSEKLDEVFIRSLTGLTLTQTQRVALQVAQNSKHKKHIFVTNLIQKLKDLNYKLVVISGSIDFMVQAFCEVYGFDVGYGNGYQISESLQYSFCEPITWTDKQYIVRKALSENNWSNIEQIVAVGDTAGDIGLFAEADMCIAVNPTNNLVFGIENILKESGSNKQFFVVMESKDSVLLSECSTNSENPGLKLTNSRFLLPKETGIF